MLVHSGVKHLIPGRDYFFLFRRRSTPRRMFSITDTGSQ